MKLDLRKSQSYVYAGNAVTDFQATPPFKFLALEQLKKPA